MPRANRQVLLKRRPQGAPTLDDFAFDESEVGSPDEGQVLLKNLYLSLDPAIRGWMSERKSYLPPIALGSPVRSGTLSQVIESRAQDWSPGDLVQALAAWEEYSIVAPQSIFGRIAPIEGVALPSMLSVLGGNGLTAYFGLLEIGKPERGDTVLVTAAAGGVGSVVGQLAKIHGCRAVGMTGSDDKCHYLIDELGYDGAINYKKKDLRAAIKAECPQGVDVFFDSVGGEILEAGLTRINHGARVVVCGAISQINEDMPTYGPRNYLQLMVKRARMEGFVTLDYAPRYDEARRCIATWIEEGKIRYRDDIMDGLEHAPMHLLRLFSGDHRGKLMIKLADAQGMGT